MIDNEGWAQSGQAGVTIPGMTVCRGAKMDEFAENVMDGESVLGRVFMITGVNVLASNNVVGKISFPSLTLPVSAGAQVGHVGSGLVGMVDMVVNSGLVGKVGVNTGVVSDVPHEGQVGSGLVGNVDSVVSSGLVGNVGVNTGVVSDG